MNSNLVIMIISIVGIVMCANVLKAYFERRERQPEPDEDLEESLAKIDQLEERIRVLERIITEKRYDLKKEIDSL